MLYSPSPPITPLPPSASPPLSLLLEMLTSLNSHTGGGTHHHHHHPNHQSLPHGLIAPSTQSRRLLITCAELIHRADYSAARHIISLLSTISSPHGDAADRLVHQFTRALSLRIDHLAHLFSPSSFSSDIGDALRSSYLSLNKVTPFLRFAHLTANQAILEAIDGRRSVHILDFDTSHGVQWPPLLQAIAERSHPSNQLPSIRITGTGTDLDVLHRTGDRLRAFANSLGLRFQFQPLCLHTTHLDTGTSFSSVQLHPGETLAVNCVLFLHKLLRDRSGDPTCKLAAFLHAVRAMNPVVVTVAEREANHNSPVFLQRFMEALDHYTAVFESLEATLPPKSRERLEVEQGWLGREIEDIAGREGEGRRERHERFDWWEGLMRGRGFSSLPLSPFALSQAKLLLRLHYPSEGYQLQMSKNSLFLGWQHKPLFSVSSWH